MRWNKVILSRSMRISVWLPYALMSTASLSICSSVQPDLRLMIFSSYSLLVQRSQSNLTPCRKHTVLVIPSVNRTNSILFPGPSQSGFRVKTSRRAEVSESALLYERGMYLKFDKALPLDPFVEPILEVYGRRTCL